MNPFLLVMTLYQMFQALHSSLTAGGLSQMHGIVHVVAQMDPAQEQGGAVGPQVPISTVTL